MYRVFLPIGLFFLSLAASGQVLINEFCASNSTVIADPDFNDYADWIELYNAGGSAVNLSGYFLTDNLALPGKWQITGEAVIDPGSFLIIWTDGRDTGLHASFKISASGEAIGLFSPALVMLDTISFGVQKTDISYGRDPDGGPVWGFFEQPTPNAPNSTTSVTDFVSTVPEFSLRGGFYSTSLSVSLFTDQGGEIRFTTDGSEPDAGSQLFSSPIPISITTILRARIFKPDMLPGPTVTQSYFIDENSVGAKLPVVSIASAPENFWDPTIGIYVQDFKPLWEIPINIELFENNGSDRAAFNERAGAKINGLYSWQLPQKMVGIYFKKQYGTSNLEYPVIHQRKRNSYKSFALRASGSDWSYTLFRDILGQHSTLLNMDLDVMGFRPAVVYFNGAYMGIHNIREKVDDDYIEKSYHLEPGSFDLVEYEDYAEAGDLAAYEYLHSLFDLDLSLDANYNAVAELVDIENLTDYLITEMATANTSIDHNVMAWKPKDGGKWRWVVMDLDRGFFNPADHMINFYISKDELHLNDLIRNQSYLNYFAGRLSAQLYTSFHPDRMNRLIDQHAADIESEIPVHIDRWKGATSSYGNAIPSEQYWRDEICDLRAFVQERPGALLSNLRNYGFNDIATLALSNFPENAGTIKIDGLLVPGSTWSGPYIKDLTIHLRAEEKPGYAFTGWANSAKQVVFPMGSVWKYLDTGVYPGTGWKELNFTDDAWNSGAGQFGYGDGDETTVISYGGSSQNKYITTYFRKNFTLTNEDLQAAQFEVKLVKDDGAVVYLNGNEIIRANMGCGDIEYQTLAASSLSGTAESNPSTFRVDRELLNEGENVLAVEIHQNVASSSDMSFDLEFSGYHSDLNDLVTTSPEFTFTLVEDRLAMAVYTRTSDCILPDTIDSDLSLGIGCSPYLAQGDVTIGRNATLTIEPGVEIWMPPGATIFVNGAMHVDGNSDQGVTIKLNPDFAPESWGVITFRNTPAASTLNYLTLEDASTGPDPVLDIAALSAFHADLNLDHLVIENVQGNPIVARYSDIHLSNSVLHSVITGDLINVKYGKAEISNCRFYGNDRPDTDAIDYDEIENGVINNCEISGFLGFNSDAIDLGENASGVVIDSIFIYHITDKGVSVGQRSSATIRNSVFVNCNMGVGIKDSANVVVDHSVFYSNGYSIACFEKNLGDAGGNARVTNSILSNSTMAPVFVDSKSTLDITYSLADTKVLPEHPTNRSGNPLFASPTFFNFGLLPGSPGLQTGMDGGVPADMGFPFSSSYYEPPVMIYRIFLSAGDLDLPEFITLYNPSTKSVDLSGYTFTKGITTTIPEGTFLEAGEILYLTSNAYVYDWTLVAAQVLQWDSGRLANEGETLQLEDSYGIVIDHLEVENNGSWPPAAFSGNMYLQLIDPGLDNHFPESWRSEPVQQVINSVEPPAPGTLRVYPNPARDLVTIEGTGYQNRDVEIYDLAGQLRGRFQLNENGKCTLDLSAYPAGMLLIKVAGSTHKVVVID